MENETEYYQSLKRTLITYIKIYDPLYTDVNLDGQTVDQLMVIFTQIELEKPKQVLGISKN